MKRKAEKLKFALSVNIFTILLYLRQSDSILFIDYLFKL